MATSSVKSITAKINLLLETAINRVVFSLNVQLWIFMGFKFGYFCVVTYSKNGLFIWSEIFFLHVLLSTLLVLALVVLKGSGYCYSAAKSYCFQKNGPSLERNGQQLICYWLSNLFVIAVFRWHQLKSDIVALSFSVFRGLS